jgi:hypothetical protein
VLLPVDLPPHRQQIGKAAMAFREVHVHEIREVLRVWLRGESLRSVERLAALDRKTVRRYVQMKDPSVVSFSPMFHWTEQKIRVHVFYCTLTLTVARLMVREAERAGLHLSVRALLGILVRS